MVSPILEETLKLPAILIDSKQSIRNQNSLDVIGRYSYIWFPPDKFREILIMLILSLTYFLCSIPSTIQALAMTGSPFNLDSLDLYNRW